MVIDGPRFEPEKLIWTAGSEVSDLLNAKKLLRFFLASNKQQFSVLWLNKTFLDLFKD
jgi:hypothetical protein